jgi:hypothetical protein
MDAKAKKALVETLSDAKNFDTLYPAPSRRWFVDKSIRTFEAQTMSDVQIETKTIELIVKATTIVMAKRDFSIGVTLGTSLATIQRGRRVEILYGSIATDQALAETANADLLDWTAKRRLRGVTRMDFFVNPNKQGYFRYPKTCKTNRKWRVNVDAQPFWDPSPAFPADQFPFLLKRPGTGDPPYVTAIAKLWTKKKEPCDGNLLDCGVTAGTVLLETLREAKDPPKLLKKVDGRGPKNLAIHHVGMVGTDNLFGDTSAEGLFDRADVLVDDLVVGDHVYIFNHPLYKVFHPNDSWTGEHSLVYNCGDRGVKSRSGYSFGGHGKEGTVYAFYDDFLVDLLTDLHRAFRIGAIFLVWMSSGMTTIPSSQIINDTLPFTDANGNVIPVDLYQFDVSFKFNDYTKTPTSSRKKPQKSETGFVIGHFAAQNVFVIARDKKLVDVLKDGKFSEAIGFTRTTDDPTHVFDPVQWGVSYRDHSTNVELRYPLFTKESGKLTFKPLTIDDLFASPFGKRDPKKEEIGTTRPRVSSTAAYKSFLSTNGAI